MRLFFFVLCSFLLTSYTSDSHKFYVSTTTIEQDASGAQLAMSLMLFTDDLETALGDAEHEEIHLGEDDEQANADGLIEDYLRKHFSLRFDDMENTYRYLGKEVELDITWVYLELVLPPAIHTLEVKNDLFMEVFEDQTNIVQVELRGKKETLHLNRFRKSQVITY